MNSENSDDHSNSTTNEGGLFSNSGACCLFPFCIILFMGAIAVMQDGSTAGAIVWGLCGCLCVWASSTTRWV